MLRSLINFSATILFVAIAATATAAAPCNEPGVVGGGMLGVSPGPVGPPNSLGFDVGSGQCNGSFTIVTSDKFPSRGQALELAMRIEQRRVGPVQNDGGSYLVQTGPDPTQANRSWWNFQHSIAYQGDIDDLDALCFAIRTDEGSSVPAEPADMLALRIAPDIDDRNNQPNPTTEFSDLYQTSQNPVFGWLTNGAGGPYNSSEPGAWTLTLTALENGRVSEVSVCVHTPTAQCDPLSMKHRDVRRRALACVGEE